MTDDKFLQEQINDLQTGHEELRGMVKHIGDQADRDHDTLADVSNNMEFIKRNMMTQDKLAIALEIERNQQIVKGLKWVLGLVVATIAVKWAEALHWFQDIGN